jgi:hypothetical protein
MFATNAEVDVYHAVMARQLASKFGIQFDRMKLVKVELPAVTVAEQGKVGLYFFSIELILWNNSALINLQSLSSTSYADPGLKMREHLCFCYCGGADSSLIF